MKMWIFVGKVKSVEIWRESLDDYSILACVHGLEIVWSSSRRVRKYEIDASLDCFREREKERMGWRQRGRCLIDLSSNRVS